MHRRISRLHHRALTLLEVLITLTLISGLLLALMTFFWQTLEIREKAATEADRTAIVHQMLSQIAGEMRNAVAAEQIGFPITRFQGDRRSVTFTTVRIPDRYSYVFYGANEEPYAPQPDLRQVGYRLWIDPEEETEEGEPLVGGILRTERRALEPFLTEDDVPEDEDLLYKRHDLWAPELGYLEFRYFDGAEWSTTWNVAAGNPLPHMVQITVGFDSITHDDLEDRDLEQYPLDQYPLNPDEYPNPNRFSFIVPIRAADQTFGSRVNKLGDQMTEFYEFGGLDEEALQEMGGDLEGALDEFGEEEDER